MKIGIMGGSFNPVHIGHLMVADYIRQHAGLDRVLMILSPLNPLKAGSSELVDDRRRLQMLDIACRQYDGLYASDVELNMPRPSFTIDTLNLISQHADPSDELFLIIGDDNWQVFDKWRAYDEILRGYKVIVYPRDAQSSASSAPSPSLASLPRPIFIDAPKIDISSTFIRNQISEGYNMDTFLPKGVFDYIKTQQLYGYHS